MLRTAATGARAAHGPGHLGPSGVLAGRRAPGSFCAVVRVHPWLIDIDYVICRHAFCKVFQRIWDSPLSLLRTHASKYCRESRRLRIDLSNEENPRPFGGPARSCAARGCRATRAQDRARPRAVLRDYTLSDTNVVQKW